MAKASIQMINKTESGNNELYPITRDKEVKVVPSTSNNLPSSASNANDVFNSLGKLAFADTVDIESEINDEVTSTDYSWSGSKVNKEIEAAKTYADGKASSALSSANSYADNKDTTVLNNAKSYANGLISDTETATNKLWSSTKTDDTITNKTAEALNTAKGYADTQDSVILESAKEYTDLRLTGDGSALAEHTAVVGNSTTPGHVKLSDKYTESDGDSASSVGASSKAVYDAYTALNTEITGIKTAMNTTDGGFATKTYVANLIAANLLKKEIVDSLPTENISSNTIYLVDIENGY